MSTILPLIKLFFLIHIPLQIQWRTTMKLNLNISSPPWRLKKTVPYSFRYSFKNKVKIGEKVNARITNVSSFSIFPIIPNLMNYVDYLCKMQMYNFIEIYHLNIKRKMILILHFLYAGAGGK